VYGSWPYLAVCDIGEGQRSNMQICVYHTIVCCGVLRVLTGGRSSSIGFVSLWRYQLRASAPRLAAAVEFGALTSVLDRRQQFELTASAIGTDRNAKSRRASYTQFDVVFCCRRWGGIFSALTNGAARYVSCPRNRRRGLTTQYIAD